jgi:hypothetical protein
VILLAAGRQLALHLAREILDRDANLRAERSSRR